MNNTMENIMNVVKDIQFILDSSNEVLSMSKDDYLAKITEEYGADFSDRKHYYPMMCGALEGYLNLIQEKIVKLEKKMEKLNETK